MRTDAAAFNSLICPSIYHIKYAFKHTHTPLTPLAGCHFKVLSLSLSRLFARIKIDILNQEYTVYYVGTNLGRIYKIVQYYRNGESLSKLLDIFEVAPNEAIQVMEISQTRKSLYVGTDHRIKQIDLAMCNRRYDNCFRCVRDPYCGWDKEANTCRPYELDLLQVSVNQGETPVSCPEI